MEEVAFTFGEIDFIDGYALITVSGDIELQTSHVQAINQATEEAFYGKPFVSIFDCRNGMAINNNFARQLQALDGLLAAAFICEQETCFYQLDDLRDEQESLSIMITTTLEDAVSWAKLQLNRHNH